MDKELQLKVKLVRAWVNVIQRCYDSRSEMYVWYGARGIKMCPKWLASIDQFVDDMGLPPALDYSIDRINVNGDYEPSNCRWATQEEQNNNTRRSNLVTWNGKTQSVRDWAKEYDVGTRRLHERLSRGWSMERALNTACPRGFEAELADRRERNRANWKEKGRDYRARSSIKRTSRPAS